MNQRTQECRVEGCNRLVKSNWLCVQHRKNWLAEEPFVNLPPKRSKGVLVCTYPGCDRPYYANGYCRAHDSQRRRGNGMYEVGNTDVSNEIRRQAWARLTPDEKAARLANSMHRDGPYVRTDEWRRRMSRERMGVSPNICGERYCAGCGTPFQPRSGHHRWCTAECQRANNRALAHGITLPELRDIEQRQGGGCAICGKVTKLVIDHDHDTKRFRGLLCTTCNTGLGKLGDSADNLRRAIAYLES